MDGSEVIAALRPHEAELRRAGVRALYLFGSTARGTAQPGSDVDLACDLDEDPSINLLDFIDVKLKISDLLRTRVDLVERDALRPRVRERVEAEMVRVF